MQASISSDSQYDVVIVGGGMVGSMLAALLAEYTDLKIAVLEQQQPPPFEPGSEPGYDIRVSALSIATQHMLVRVGAWQGVLDRRACAYDEMLVWDGEESGKTHFRATDIGVGSLGHIVENRVVQLALNDCLQQAHNVDYLCPVQVLGINQNPDAVTVTVTSGKDNDNDQQHLCAHLLIGADGANSSVRKFAGIDMQREAYEHHALVASIETKMPEQSITWQRFMPTGPQAFLPLHGSRASLVWYHNADEINRLKTLDDEKLAAQFIQHFPERLGEIRNIQGRGSFPIVKAHAQRYICERIALVGDAAHTVHPLAGQGVNLGMLDAAALAELITDANGSDTDIGSRRLLRRYERWRRGDNAMMLNILDGFYHAFKPQPAPLRKIRSLAMTAADNAGPLKHSVMRYAMGTSGDLPRFAR